MNVLFIVVDDLRVSLGCYGDPVAVTPNIDRLAREGIVFNRAYCQEGICNPSRASLLTGRRPDTIRVWDLSAHFRDALPEVVTLPQYFKQNGYRTRSIGKVLHGTGRPAKDPPSWSDPPEFDVLENRGKDFYALESNRTPKRGFKHAAAECADVSDDAYVDGRVCKAAKEALQELKDDGRPFFLAVGFRKPHLPFSAPKKYWDLFDRNALSRPHPPRPPEGVPDLALHQWPELRGYTDIPGDGPLKPAKIAELRHGYYAAASYMDAQVGKLLDQLESLGLKGNTLVVLWGDHGYHVGEQNLWGKMTNFEICTRSPLILSAPGRAPAGASTDALVEFVDLYPTLVELCGLKMPAGLEGASLAPLLANPKRQWKKAAFSQFPRPVASNLRGGKPDIMGYSIRTNRYRYTEWREMTGGEVRARELYDHDKDPLETRNLARLPEFAQTLEELGRILREGWKTAVPARD